MSEQSARPADAPPAGGASISSVASPAPQHEPVVQATHAVAIANATVGAIAVGPGARAEGIVNVTLLQAANPSIVLPTHRQISAITSSSWQFALAEERQDSRYVTISELYLLIGYSFLSAEASTGLGQFGFLMSHMAKRSTANMGALDSAISLCCHVTAFVNEFAQLTESFERGRFVDRTACYPENLGLEYDWTFGVHMPCSVERVGPNKIRIRNLSGAALIFRFPLRTSDILFYLSGFARGVPVGIDDLDLSALTEHERRFLRYTERLKKQGRISLKDIHVSTTDPEQWNIA